jgi:hypothetical protein
LEPCLVCGASVHPIAGRCKECKSDLAALREERARSQRREARQEAATHAIKATHATQATHATHDNARQAPVAAGGAKARWPHWRLALAALLVLGVGIVGGVLAERLVTTQKRPSVQQASTMVSLTAADQAKIPARRPDPRDPRIGIQLPGVGTAAAPASVSAFGVALGQAMCGTLERCGIVQGLGSGLCQLMAGQLVDADTDDRVASGDCHFDQLAAKACVDLLSAVDCQDAADPAALLSMASGIVACTQALDCPADVAPFGP